MGSKGTVWDHWSVPPTSQGQFLLKQHQAAPEPTAMPGLAKCNWVGWRVSLENRAVGEPCPTPSRLALPCPVVAKWLKEKNQGNQAVK